MMDLIVNTFIDILPVLIASGVILYIFHEYLRFMNEREKRSALGKSAEGQASSASVGSEPNPTTTKLKLQAAERFVLYLERIEPGRLVMRTHQNGMSAKMLQNEMLRAIREEFDHNLSQQIYISEGAWNLVKNAKEEMTKFITACGEGMPKDAGSIDFSKKLFQAASQVEKLPSDVALAYLRKEVRDILQK
jgi:hypothetical protein